MATTTTTATRARNRRAAAFCLLATAAHAGLPLLATPAAPVGAALLLLCGPAAVVVGSGL